MNTTPAAAGGQASPAAAGGQASIAIVGIACRYPDASSPADLWENVLAGRRAFRRIPDERLRLEDYWSPDRAAPDRFYTRKAAVIEGFEFDRVKYKVAGSTFRTTDSSDDEQAPSTVNPPPPRSK